LFYIAFILISKNVPVTITEKLGETVRSPTQGKDMILKMPKFSRNATWDSNRSPFQFGSQVKKLNTNVKEKDTRICEKYTESAPIQQLESSIEEKEELISEMKNQQAATNNQLKEANEELNQARAKIEVKNSELSNSAENEEKLRQTSEKMYNDNMKMSQEISEYKSMVLILEQAKEKAVTKANAHYAAIESLRWSFFSF